MKFLGLVIVAIAASLLLVGCSGNSGAQAPAQGDKTTPAAFQNASPQPQGNAGQGAPKEEKKADSAPAASDNAADSLAKYFGMKNGNGFTVDYTTSTTAGNYSSTSKSTMYFKDENNIRMDATASGMEIRSYMSSGNLYSCLKSGSSWTCYSSGTYNNSGTEKVEKDFLANKAKYKIEKLPSRTVAGATCECYKTTVDNGYVEYCFSPEGVPLYTKTSGTSEGMEVQAIVEATSYKTSVSDSDFVLPAKPSAMPSFPGAGSAGSDGAGGSGSSGSSETVDYSQIPCSSCGYLSGSYKDECLSSCTG
jgi:hypothetical protein